MTRARRLLPGVALRMFDATMLLQVQGENALFVNVADKLGPTGLAEAGTQLGLGTPWDLGIDAFSGKVSSGGSAVEQAAAAFGQGTTVVSPLAMAGATAAVARGEFRQPQLVVQPKPASPTGFWIFRALAGFLERHSLLL